MKRQLGNYNWTRVSKRLATGWTTGVRLPAQARIVLLATIASRPALEPIQPRIQRIPAREFYGRSMKLTANLHLVPRLRMNGALPTRPLYLLLCCVGWEWRGWVRYDSGPPARTLRGYAELRWCQLFAFYLFKPRGGGLQVFVALCNQQRLVELWPAGSNHNNNHNENTNDNDSNNEINEL
jgi:hypothetical protein